MHYLKIIQFTVKTGLQYILKAAAEQRVIFVAELFVRWEKPLITNGLLEQYDLRMDSNLVYSGLNTSVTISDLAPYTQYRFLLLACTGKLISYIYIPRVILTYLYLVPTMCLGVGVFDLGVRF